ncbi:hypothetical protein RU93_GL001656 [Enterococcus aquimarinus]|uniref:Uncharacterized protein n=2 Tax=Enterococcus aquimarinus TaxID=328396 RepID=A0A1L8QUI1_9ENTE|nr:hypothetical protein RU93_GL001656 [Enterococcus aquimarinus]
MKMKKKKWVVLVGVIAVAIGGWFYQEVKENEVAEAQEELKSNQQLVGKDGDLTLAVERLEDASGYLKMNIKENDFTQLEAQLAAVKSENNQLIAKYKLKSNAVRHVERLEERLSLLRQRFEFQEEINQLFIDGTAINQGVFNQKLVLKKDLTQLDIEKLEKSFEQMFEYQEDSWITMMEQSLEAILGQVIIINNASRMIADSKVEDAKNLVILLNNLTATETKMALLSQMTGELQEAVFEELQLSNRL